jgi:glycosyltransferase involved in cell wall biosynthesis
MTTEAKVAICIPTYNQGAYLEQAVMSAVAQSFPCEIWVSDDLSTDATPEIMARLVKQHSNLRYIRHDRNLGIKGNPGWILRQPKTEFIVRLDSDDELYPNYVEKMLEVISPSPETGYAHAAVQEIDGEGRCLRLRLLARGSGFQSGDESLRVSLTGYRVAANICMFRRAALEEVGYYRELSFAEDWDMAVRIADAGWGNIYLNEVLARYRVWETKDSQRSRRKLAEIEGCSRVFHDSLTAAFKRRNWDLSRVQRASKRIASKHADSLQSALFDKDERDKLKQALRELGDSPNLRWKLRWINTPLAPFMQLPGRAVSYAKAGVKRIFFPLRGNS